MQDGWKKEIAEVLQELRIKEKVRGSQICFYFTSFERYHEIAFAILRYCFDSFILFRMRDDQEIRAFNHIFLPHIFKFKISLHFHALLY